MSDAFNGNGPFSPVSAIQSPLNLCRIGRQNSLSRTAGLLLLPLVPEQAEHNFVFRDTINDVVFAEQAFAYEARLFQDAAGCGVPVVHVCDELAQWRFAEALPDEQIHSGGRDSPALAMPGDSVADFRVPHTVADILQADAARHSIFTLDEPPITGVLGQVGENGAFGLEHGGDLFPAHWLQRVVPNGEGLNPPLHVEVQERGLVRNQIYAGGHCPPIISAQATRARFTAD